MPEQLYVFAGIKECGCTMGVTPDKPEYEEENAKAISSWLRMGMTVVRIEDGRINNKLCGRHAWRKEDAQS